METLIFFQQELKERREGLKSGKVHILSIRELRREIREVKRELKEGVRK